MPAYLPYRVFEKNKRNHVKLINVPDDLENHKQFPDVKLNIGERTLKMPLNMDDYTDVLINFKDWKDILDAIEGWESQVLKYWKSRKQEHRRQAKKEHYKMKQKIQRQEYETAENPGN